MRKAFDWKRSRISMLEEQAVPQSCIQIGLSIVLYMRSLLLVESFNLRPSNQYILVRTIPSRFRFAKMCLCQVSLLSRCSPSDYTVDVSQCDPLKNQRSPTRPHVVMPKHFFFKLCYTFIYLSMH
jgi:hypothetical protein